MTVGDACAAALVDLVGALAGGAVAGTLPPDGAVDGVAGDLDGAVAGVATAGVTRGAECVAGGDCSLLT